MKGSRRLLAVAAVLILAGPASWWVANRLWPFPEPSLHRGGSMQLFDRSGVPVRFFLAADDTWRIPVGLDEVPPLLIEALVAVEDRRFFTHRGVDLLAVARAAIQNLAAGGVVSGASTLPMQIARMTEPAPRGWSAKLREAFRGKVRHVVLIGRDAPALAATLAGVCATERATDMPAAVRAAQAVAQPGDTVLLSPACASLDMFRDYSHRGDEFAATVRSLAA